MSTSIEQAATMLKELLGNLTSPDNEIRTKAESSLTSEWIATQPQSLLGSLAFLVHRDTDPQGRAFASVLLRRISFQNMPAAENKEDELSVWSVVGAEVQQIVRSELMGALKDETDTDARHKLCDTIAEIFNESESEADWPDLLPALYACAQDSNPSLRESAYRVFASCTYLLSKQNSESVVNAFVGAFRDSDGKVRLAALKAGVNYILDVGERERARISGMLPQMLSVLEPLVRDGDEDGLVDGLTALIDAAEDLPKLFRAVLDNVTTFATELGRNASLESRTRQTAMELLVTLAESAPGMCRKNGQFAQTVVPVCMQLMSSVEDDAEWHTTDTLDDGDNDADYIFGEQSLDRLAIALGGKQVLPVAFKYIQQMLASESWEQRHAALMAISSIGEGCQNIMRGELQQILGMIVPFFNDSNARVRYAACNCVGQMSTDFAPGLQEKHHALILQHLLPVLEKSDSPRVQTHAAAAMVNFAEEASKRVLDPYLDALLERLLTMLGSSRRYVQEQAITTIATIADNAQEKFSKYYGTIMPMLLQVLEQATDTEHRLLRGKAMECATFIGMAVGRDMFAADIPRFVKILTETQQSVVEADDPQASYLQAAWARLSRVMGAEFAPLLSVVMPPLMTAANLNPDFAVLGADEDASAQYSAEDGWEFANIGGQQVGIKTTTLEEKCAAMELLGSYARDLGAAFVPYAAESLEVAVPLLKFYFHEGVRGAAAAAIPAILQTLKAAGDINAMATAWTASCDRFLSVMGDEDDDAFVLQLFMSFAEAIETLGPNTMTPQQMLEFATACAAQMNKYHGRIRHRAAARQAEELDDDDEEDLAEEEILEGLAADEISKAIHAVFAAHGAAFAEPFEAIVPVARLMIAEPGDSPRQWAICVFDDLVEYTGAASAKYAGDFVPSIAAALEDRKSSDLRQAAAYGVGVMAQFGGDAYTEFVAGAALPVLLREMQRPDGRESENVFATENMTASIGKILQFRAASVPDAPRLLHEWFRGLPVCHDMDEAPGVHTFLLQAVREQPSALLGGRADDPQALRQLAHVVVEALAMCDFESDLASKLAALVRDSLSSLDDTARSALWSEISSEKQQALHEKGLFQ